MAPIYERRAASKPPATAEGLIKENAATATCSILAQLQGHFGFEVRHAKLLPTSSPVLSPSRAQFGGRAGFFSRLL